MNSGTEPGAALLMQQEILQRTDLSGLWLRRRGMITLSPNSFKVVDAGTAMAGTVSS